MPSAEEIIQLIRSLVSEAPIVKGDADSPPNIDDKGNEVKGSETQVRYNKANEPQV